MALLEFAWNEHPILNISLKNLAKKAHPYWLCGMHQEHEKEKNIAYIGDDSFLPIHPILRRECHCFGSGNDIMRLYKFICIHITYLYILTIPSPQALFLHNSGNFRKIHEKKQIFGNETNSTFSKRRAVWGSRSRHFPCRRERIEDVLATLLRISYLGHQWFWGAPVLQRSQNGIIMYNIINYYTECIYIYIHL